jgi:hypothetical protein
MPFDVSLRGNCASWLPTMHVLPGLVEPNTLLAGSSTGGAMSETYETLVWVLFVVSLLVAGMALP